MRFYGQWDPPVDKFLYDNYFKDKKGGTCIECGALDGLLESSCKFFEESMEWTTVNVEPVPPLYDMLCKNRPDSINIRAALSSRSGTAEFTHAIHPSLGKRFGNGSLAHTTAHKQSLINDGCKFEKYNVDLITYNELLELSGIKSLDLFVLDVEGHELQVLNGMHGAKLLPKVFCIEHGHTGQQIDKHLTKLGYRLDKKSHNNSFYIKT